MKTKILLTTLLSFIFYLLSSQVPQGFNYQAIARDGDGNLITYPFFIKVEIQNLAADTVFWIEEHNVTPNEYGLISFVVGQTGRIGGTAINFSDIDWISRPRYVRTSAKYPGPDYTEMGTTQIWSVPYALVASSVGDTLDKLVVKSQTDMNDEALFEVRNKDGQIIFAVYNEGVRVYVSDGDKKGVKGGFAIGGFGVDKQGVQKYLFVSGDSIRAYIDSTSVKGVKGGFAIGGFENTKAPGQEYLRVTRDSVRVYLDANPATKAVKGGFAIGGFDVTKDGIPIQNYLDVTPSTTKILTTDTVKGFSVGNLITGTVENYMKLTPSNYFIGHEAGKKITTGIYNSIMGFKAGSSLTTGKTNVLIGYKAGLNLEDGESNSIVGYEGGYKMKTGWSNTILGDQAGYNTTDGSNNVFIGQSAGFENSSGYQNVFIGPWAGKSNKTSNRNTYVGYEAGSSTTGGRNTLIGCQTGGNLLNASGNTFVGYQAGVTTYYGNYNVCIGQAAGGATDGPGPNLLGNGNVYVGSGAGFWHEGDGNVIIGASAGGLTTSCLNGSGNVFIGREAGYFETGSNKLFIDNQQRASESDAKIKALVYGIFDASTANQRLTINGNVGIGTSPGTNKFSISGLASSTTGSTLVISGNDVFYLTSKRDAKENIVPLIDDFEKILNAQPVSFTDKMTGKPGIGYIAEDFEQAGLQNLLVYENGELVSLRYDLISVYNLEIIKEQQKQIDYQKQENRQLKSQLQSLQEKVEHIESLSNKCK